jgi:hypothetical protein
MKMNKNCLEDLALKSGKYAKIDNFIRNLAKDIMKQCPDQPLEGISEYIEKNLNRPKVSIKDEIFKEKWCKRTASEVIQDGYCLDCTDISIIFIALARAMGFPTIYVETVEKDWWDMPNGYMSGHVFADVKVNGEWKIYEPLRGFKKDYTLTDDNKTLKYVAMGRGVDPGEVYIMKKGGYAKKPVALTKVDVLTDTAMFWKYVKDCGE